MNTNKSDQYENPALTVDVLIFSIQENKLKVVLIKRGQDPFKDSWAIPGGFVHIDETLEDAARRELAEETGIKDVYLEQLYTFGDIDRDPRKRVVSVAYMALLPTTQVELKATTDAADAAWFDVADLPKLAFDHNQIINSAVKRLRSKIGYSSIIFTLLPEKFRLSTLQKVYEIILGTELDKRNFRKKILSTDLLTSTGRKELDGAHRPAMLYSFKNRDVVYYEYFFGLKK